MRTKFLIIGIGLLLAGGGLWLGRAAMRARHQTVSLDVRDMPLAQVLRQIERQTRRKIFAEQAVDARVTLHVNDKPLSYVLDRLVEQAGARWSTVYAVYGSGRSLEALESALRGDGKLEPAGWAQIAPASQELDQSGLMENGSPFAANSNGDPPGPMPRGPMMFRKMGDGPMIVQGNGGTELWSPEELVVENILRARLDNEPRPVATAASAAETARKVGGKWITYVALRKSVLGIRAGGMAPPGPGANPFKRGPNDRFARLTPEQRVQQIRQRMTFNEK